MSDFELVKLDTAQFAQLVRAIDTQSTEITKWLALQNETIAKGLADLVKAVTETSLPQPQPNQLEVKIVFKVKDDHADETFSVSISGVTDAEGQPLPDASGLTTEVTSSDDSVLAVTFDAASGNGSVHFGAPGVASLTASVKNANGDILGSGAADFTVTTGDPAAVSDVALSFPNLTPEP